MKKCFLLSIIFILASFSSVQAKNISATLFLNGDVVDQFENDYF